MKSTELRRYAGLKVVMKYVDEGRYTPVPCYTVSGDCVSVSPATVWVHGIDGGDFFIKHADIISIEETA